MHKVNTAGRERARSNAYPVESKRAESLECSFGYERAVLRVSSLPRERAESDDRVKLSERDG